MPIQVLVPNVLSWFILQLSTTLSQRRVEPVNRDMWHLNRDRDSWVYGPRSPEQSGQPHEDQLLLDEDMFQVGFVPVNRSLGMFPWQCVFFLCVCERLCESETDPHMYTVDHTSVLSSCQSMSLHSGTTQLFVFMLFSERPMFLIYMFQSLTNMGSCSGKVC